MQGHRMLTGKWLALALCAAVASGCASVTNPDAAPPAQSFPEPAPSPPLPPQPEPAPVSPPEPAIVTAPEPSSQARSYELQDWPALPDWNNDNLAEALPAFLLSCNTLKSAAEWASACAAAAQIRREDAMAARQFFESAFVPWLVHNADGGTEGLVTGYYEPLLHGSRIFGRAYRFPIYGMPPDLLVIDLAGSNPELKGIRLRGRMQDNKIVAYYTRAEIERGVAPVRGREILWVDDPIELFFLHIQGSGRVRLPGGETVRVGFAEHNGHPYRSIGRILVERGELSADKASMQGIKQWAAKNPNRLAPLLQQNPAYVFFRELPESPLGPVGAQGVPLTPGRSIAVDALTTPLGAPVFLSTTSPLSARPLNRLVVAQDTGAAIKGAVRADYFWGFGDEAAQSAGRMRQSGRMWILYPRGFQPKPP
jgi:membrane-bound lytic murein transglycosylase A